MNEITAEFNTEQIKQEANALPGNVALETAPSTSSKVPIVIGFITMLVMAVLCYAIWLKGL